MYMFSWWDADKENEKERVDDCSNTVLLCVKRTRAPCTSSAAVSIPSFFPFFSPSLCLRLSLCLSLSLPSLVLLGRLLASFFLFVLCYTFNCTKNTAAKREEKKNRNGDAAGRVSLITSSLLFSSYASNRTEAIFLCATVSARPISSIDIWLRATSISIADPFCRFLFTSSTNYLHLLCSRRFLRLSFPDAIRLDDPIAGNYARGLCLRTRVCLRNDKMPTEFFHSDEILQIKTRNNNKQAIDGQSQYWFNCRQVTRMTSERVSMSNPSHVRFLLITANTGTVFEKVQASFERFLFLHSSVFDFYFSPNY